MQSPEHSGNKNRINLSIAFSSFPPTYFSIHTGVGQTKLHLQCKEDIGRMSRFVLLNSVKSLRNRLMQGNTHSCFPEKTETPETFRQNMLITSGQQRAGC
jgi:hypothetical protein